MSEPPEPSPPPPQRENPVTQGMRYGVVGALGCLTSIFVLLLVLSLAVSHNGGAALFVLLIATIGIPLLVRRRRRRRP